MQLLNNFEIKRTEGENGGKWTMSKGDREMDREKRSLTKEIERNRENKRQRDRQKKDRWSILRSSNVSLLVPEKG